MIGRTAVVLPEADVVDAVLGVITGNALICQWIGLSSVPDGAVNSVSATSKTCGMFLALGCRIEDAGNVKDRERCVLSLQPAATLRTTAMVRPIDVAYVHGLWRAISRRVVSTILASLSGGRSRDSGSQNSDQACVGKCICQGSGQVNNEQCDIGANLRENTA